MLKRSILLSYLVKYAKLALIIQQPGKQRFSYPLKWSLIPTRPTSHLFRFPFVILHQKALLHY